MTRKLKILGLALVAVLATSVMGASTATAVEHVTSAALFTANVGPAETAKADGEQAGAHLVTVGGKSVTCSTVTFTGQALTKGPESTKVTITPNISGCHVIMFGVTKFITITMNECFFTFNATTTTTESGASDYTAEGTIECGGGKKIEIHVYNSASSEAETLCTYDIEPQGPLTGVTVTNKTNTPTSPNDLEAHANVQLALRNTKLSVACGTEENIIATYEGTSTFRATDESASFVDTAVSG